MFSRNKFANGIYEMKNPQKYSGNKSPRYRSGWEHAFMRFCDNHPSVVNWASEAIQIPYRNPLTGKGTVYVPDFVVMYQDKNGKKHAELIEVKYSGDGSESLFVSSEVTKGGIGVLS